MLSTDLNNHCRVRRAVTLLELAVVIAIIAMIAAFALPALFRARGAALHLECSARLRQIGLGLHNYTSDWGCFPPRVISDMSIRGPKGIWGSLTCLLPYLEQGNVYNSINLARHSHDASNTTVTKMSLSVYLCPSDSIPKPFAYSGFANYVACIGSGLHPNGLDAEVGKGPTPSDGIFFGRHGVKPAECTDGLSHTAAFSEIVHGGLLHELMPDYPAPPITGLVYTLWAFTPQTQRKLIQECTSLGPNKLPRAADIAGLAWILGSDYNHLLTPNQARCWGPGGDVFSAWTASSRHPGMVHVLFVDGHVSPISNNIDQNTWRALGSRNKGELVDSEF